MLLNTHEKIIFDALYDGVLIADAAHKVVYINPAYSRITKVEREQIIGQNLNAIRPGARLPHVIETGIQELGAKRQVGDIEYIVNMVPIMEGNQIVGGVSILNEISDIYKLSEQLYQSNRKIKKLEKFMRSVGKTRYHFSDIISVDEHSYDTKSLAQKIASKESNVLLYGESGTGKELYANAIHSASERSNGPFIAVNCATFESSLLESELFGYEEGAFTGAKKGGKLGLFEVASGGTLFLDEISELDYNLQAKLLRTLQERTIRRIGGYEEIPVDVRIISATNKALDEMMKDKRFREDLYYRIAVFPINLFPLRERPKDIPELVKYFVDRLGAKYNRPLYVSDSAMKLMVSYSWPGNIRELRNAVEFAYNMTNDGEILEKHLPVVLQKKEQNLAIEDSHTLATHVKQFEQKMISDLILHYGDTVEGKKKVAKHLGISLATLYNKMN